jgi:DNA/RNA endonuclease YhcR with UshA esterase domain
MTAINCLVAAISVVGLLIQQPIGPSEAAVHVGEKATVCGIVDDARYLESAKTQPTFLNFGGKYPKHQFTAVIFGKDRAGFGTPETTYLGKHLCVWGPIALYKGKPQIILRSVVQIEGVEK